MAIILKFVDKNGCVKTLFFGAYSFNSHSGINPEKWFGYIFFSISKFYHHSLDIQNIQE